MNLKSLRIVILMSLPWWYAPAVTAEEQDLEARLENVQARIQAEEQANQQLKDEIAARDQEVAALQQRLQELEAKTATHSE